ncbi:MAG: HDIG domain-containing protein [Myxococcales bacterium]
MPTPRSADEALALLRALGAPPRLIRHHELVAEAASALLAELRKAFTLDFDDGMVLVGAALHDAGKIEHPAELDEPGSEHAESGVALLMREGVEPAVARFCRTHATWPDEEVMLEDLLVALADKLWKGKRDDELEKRVCHAIEVSTGRASWDVFEHTDDVFTAIAADGDLRLVRSRERAS